MRPKCYPRNTTTNTKEYTVQTAEPANTQYTMTTTQKHTAQNVELSWKTQE